MAHMYPEPRAANDKITSQVRSRACIFCKQDIDEVDYKDPVALRRLVSDKGRIRSRRATGMCRHHHLQAAVAVKRAREMALLPYASR